VEQGSAILDGFERAEIETGETSILVRWSGSGAPILLLHGFPQTHLMWHGVAPRLARRFTVVCADLRGYGGSGCPVSTGDDVQGRALEAGHFFPEEIPVETADALERFFHAAP
jgi:pimeloyl-ACP methyl ester carboxylesterase